jgi:hypothetical protein
VSESFFAKYVKCAAHRMHWFLSTTAVLEADHSYSNAHRFSSSYFNDIYIWSGFVYLMVTLCLLRYNISVMNGTTTQVLVISKV